MSDEDGWDNPEHPPVKEAIDLGHGVWVSWDSPYNREGKPLLWHWCTGEKWHAGEGWAPTGVEGHDLISKDPLHLEPSILWPDCCGMHGFVRGGQWISV